MSDDRKDQKNDDEEGDGVDFEKITSDAEGLVQALAGNSDEIGFLAVVLEAAYNGLESEGQFLYSVGDESDGLDLPDWEYWVDAVEDWMYAACDRFGQISDASLSSVDLKAVGTKVVDMTNDEGQLYVLMRLLREYRSAVRAEYLLTAGRRGLPLEPEQGSHATNRIAVADELFSLCDEKFQSRIEAEARKE